MEKKIKIDYFESLDIEIIEEIVQEKFSECDIKRQYWVVNTPWIIIRKGFFVRATVSIKQKRKKGLSVICINEGMDFFAAFLYSLLGITFQSDERENFVNQVEKAIEEGLMEKYGITKTN